MIKRFLAGLMMAGLLVGGVSTASAAAFVEGKNYVRLDKPLPTRDKTRIEVIEFFWYGCIHCFHFEPTLKAWGSKQADDVYLQGSPALWNKAMSLHAQAFYTAQALGVLDKLHEPLFAALNVEPKVKLNDEGDVEKFFVKHGVDKEAFRKTFNSFGVTSQVKQADARARTTGIEGTPEMLVNGRYRVSSRLAGGQSMEQMLKVVDFLIEQERAARGS